MLPFRPIAHDTPMLWSPQSAMVHSMLSAMCMDTHQCFTIFPLRAPTRTLRCRYTCMHPSFHGPLSSSRDRDSYHLIDPPLSLSFSLHFVRPPHNSPIGSRIFSSSPEQNVNLTSSVSGPNRLSKRLPFLLFATTRLSGTTFCTDI